MKNNHGEVGEALYVKMTKEKFEKMLGKSTPFENNQILTEEILDQYGISSIPVHLDENTQGEYECVCEFGVEIH